MSEGEEFEFKLRLSGPEAVERLQSLILPPGAELPPPVAQTNHFLDTEDRALRRAQLTLRLREEGAHWFLTAKGPVRDSSADGAAVVRKEEETAISVDEARALLAGGGDPVAALERAVAPRVSALLAAVRERIDGRDLVSIGCFQNERTRLRPVLLEPGGAELEFEFDRTIFPGDRVDHEVEVELASGDHATASAVERSLRALFQRAELSWETNTSKVQRFFTIVEEQTT